MIITSASPPPPSSIRRGVASRRWSNQSVGAPRCQSKAVAARSMDQQRSHRMHPRLPANGAKPSSLHLPPPRQSRQRSPRSPQTCRSSQGPPRPAWPNARREPPGESKFRPKQIPNWFKDVSVAWLRHRNVFSKNARRLGGKHIFRLRRLPYRA